MFLVVISYHPNPKVRDCFQRQKQAQPIVYFVPTIYRFSSFKCEIADLNAVGECKPNFNIKTTIPVTLFFTGGGFIKYC